MLDMMMALSIMNAVHCIREDTVLLLLNLVSKQDVRHFYAMLVLNRMVGYHARCVIGEGQIRVGLIGRLVISAQLYLK